MKRLVGALVFFLIPTGLGGSSAWAQLEPTKVLMGTWEGWRQVTLTEYTLIIESVTPQDGGWVARGSFGPKEGNVRRPRFYSGIAARGGDIILEFHVGVNPARLKLVGERKLEGTIDVARGFGGKTNQGFKFEKVEPKADDIK